VKFLHVFVACVLFVAWRALAAEPEMEKTKFKVSGVCAECEERIEKALDIKEVKSARWEKRTKVLTVVYDPSAIAPDSLQKRVAAVGHDTEDFVAPDSVYARLPACCLYRDGAEVH